MDRPEAYPITYGVLGLLAFFGPMSGYDIKRLFDHALSAMWSAAHSQIYNELRRMNNLGWVAMEREEQEMRPDRKVYQITPEGREALTHWQTQPAGVLQLRDELLLKITFGAFADKEALAINIRAGIIEHELRLLHYRENMHFIPAQGSTYASNARPNPYASQAESDPFFTLLSHFAIDFEKLYIQWLNEILTFVEGDSQTGGDACTS